MRENTLSNRSSVWGQSCLCLTENNSNVDLFVCAHVCVCTRVTELGPLGKLSLIHSLLSRHICISGGLGALVEREDIEK